uniref:MIF4G domain-containing protein n=1 Tax=Parascaris equorum TaxID=6256 RepID=A0A914S1T8_PAREQ
MCQFSGDFDGEESGAAVGQMLVQYSIEENRQAAVENNCFQGTVTALVHYFECRDRLRIDHFRVWIAFLNFVSDLYANLESLIGCLLSVGYDLERQCPEQLAILKDLIRDAFVEYGLHLQVQEPWARKMILLLMELGASGWKLPPEANEYYFQQTNS